MNDWISVEDRLPEIQKLVLLYDEDFGTNIGVMIRGDGSKWILECYDDDGFEGRATTFDVTHWMPLPPAPREEA